MALFRSHSSFLHMMLTRAFGIVLSALLLFGFGIYILLIQPTMERDANAQMDQAAGEMQASILHVGQKPSSIPCAAFSNTMPYPDRSPWIPRSPGLLI